MTPRTLGPFHFIMNIVLIGYRGSGKSAVGRSLAAHTGREFVDTDEWIQKNMNESIREIVDSRGWSFFRSLEREVIAEVAHRDRLVIAPGGGAVLDPENIRRLKENGLVIWLAASEEVLLQRMKEDPKTTGNRPTLTGKGTWTEFREVYETRRPLYEAAAEMTLDTSNLTVEEVVQRLLAVLREKAIGGT